MKSILRHLVVCFILALFFFGCAKKKEAPENAVKKAPPSEEVLETKDKPSEEKPAPQVVTRPEQPFSPEERTDTPVLEDIFAMRAWTDVSGRTIEAEFLEAWEDQKEVSLRRADGKKFTFSWNRLIPADIALIQLWIDARKSRVTEKTPEQDRQEETTAETVLPDKFILRGVPMVVQKNSYCALASGEMIAEFHGIKTDQDELASLSSEGSENNRGTYTADFTHALRNLGFDFETFYIGGISVEGFREKFLPSIKSFLYQHGPIYTAFRAGVFGDTGHACVLIGYDERKEKLFFHNPWGNKFDKSYEEVADEMREFVLAQPRAKAVFDKASVEEALRKFLPSLTGSFESAYADLSNSPLEVEILLSNRRDAKEDLSHAENTARDEGRKFIEQAMRDVSSILIPQSRDGEMQSILWLHEMKTSSKFLAYEITSTGWSSRPDQYSLTKISRGWVTQMANGEYDLPIVLIRGFEER